MRAKRVLQFPEVELGRRHETDLDEIWANDIAWKRKELFQDGRIDSPEKGLWRITETGIRKIEEKKPDWLVLNDPARRDAFLKDLDYCTPELIDWMIKIANGESLLLAKQ